MSSLSVSHRSFSKHAEWYCQDEEQAVFTCWEKNANHFGRASVGLTLPCERVINQRQDGSVAGRYYPVGSLVQKDGVSYALISKVFPRAVFGVEGAEKAARMSCTYCVDGTGKVAYTYERLMGHELLAVKNKEHEAERDCGKSGWSLEIEWLKRFQGVLGVAQYVGACCYITRRGTRKYLCWMPQHSDTQNFHDLWAQIVLQKTRYPLEKQRRIQYESLCGLVAIHAKGVVHGDIKPGNLFVNPSTGEAVVGDFGFMRQEGDPIGFCGTDKFLSPEVARAVANKNFVSGEELVKLQRMCSHKGIDLYALGLVFYGMLSEDERQGGTSAEMLLGDPSPIRTRAQWGDWIEHEIDTTHYLFPRPADEHSFAYLVWWMLRLRPEDRPSAEEALELLKKIMQRERVTCLPLTSKERRDALKAWNAQIS